MKSIKNFKYWYTYDFQNFLESFGYTIDDVKGFSVSSIKRYHGNILKTYIVYVYDGESVYFSVAYFKSFDEYNKAWLGFSGNRMLHWYEIATIKEYKLNDEYIRV